jgi:UDP-2,3-diacylglucosamine pyrophosphatase LpxH
LKYIQSSYNGSHDELIIKPIGDLHIGSPHFNYDVLMRELEKIDKNRENTRIICMGDLAETALKDSVGAGVYEQDQMIQEQIYKAKNYLWDFRDLIDGIVTGNHEQRVYQRSGIDLTQLFADIMGLRDKYLRYYGVIKYAWNKRAYNVAVWHGAGGGSTPGGAMNKLQKQAETVFADVYLMGHVHRRQAHSKIIYVPDERNNKIVKKKQVFVVTGSALNYEESYAEEKGLPPTEVGFPTIYLDGRREVKHRRTKTIKDIRVEI